MNEQVINIVIVILVACICGSLCNVFHIPAVVGYILGGCLVSNLMGHMFFDANLIKVIAELGVILLLFVIGLELKLKLFYGVLVKGAVLACLQITLGLLVSSIINIWYDWSINIVLTLGFCLAISSTAVVLSITRQQNILQKRTGRLLIAIVLFQDLALAPMMISINLDATDMIFAIIKLGLSVLLLLMVMKYIFTHQNLSLSWLQKLMTNEEATILVSLSLALFCAVLSFSLDLSQAYGAFLAGLVIGNSSIGDKVLCSILPIQYLTIMFFFFFVGLMIDLNFVFNNLKIIILGSIMLVFGKFVVNFLLFLLLRESTINALRMGLIMSQIGEFSFVMIDFSSSIYGYDNIYLQLITIMIAISLFISPMLYGLQQLIFGNRLKSMS